MPAGVKPENPKISAQAAKANAQVGYGPGNPEPLQFHEADVSAQSSSANALQAVEEYITRK